ncbi:MAG: 4-aminobutyrate--2-oxoglutarate transaminase [Actinomycetia bacterium]|nr:4-aminobutyrate--2-oxoglutarate transaminase [Actinomycetes bacterium]
MTNADLHARRTAAIPRGWGSVFPVYVDEAHGSTITDVDGRTFIDFAAGIAVVNTGHRNERVIDAVSAQLGRFTHTCFTVTPYESAVELAERLNELVPGSTPKKTMFVNSGAEAVENAVKIARYATGRDAVVAFHGGFHGRTFMTMALTGKLNPYKAGFGSMMPSVFHVPFPYPYRGVSVKESLDSLHTLFASDVAAEQVAAIVFEPVLGEGGFVPAPPEFARALRRICDEHGIVLIADEVQTGFGRTGSMFATERFGIEADITTMAKGLAGGFPLAAVTGKATIMDAPHAGGIGGTYGGSPIGCVAALAVLDEIAERDLIERANEIGAIVKDHLEAFALADRRLGEIRGLGAMVAVEIIEPGDALEPDPALTKSLISAAADAGLMLLSCGTHGNVVRFLPALTIDDQTLVDGLGRFRAALQATAS